MFTNTVKDIMKYFAFCRTTASVPTHGSLMGEYSLGSSNATNGDFPKWQPSGKILNREV